MSLRLSDFPVVSARPPGLLPTRIVLNNGVVVLSKESRKTPAVTIQLSMRAGSICDPDATIGASYLLGKVIDRGTMTRSAADIAEGLEDRGASLTVSVTRHLMTLTCTCLEADFSHVLGLLADIVRAPSIPDSELAIQKGEVITQIRQDADSPAVRAVEGLMALLYGASHPYGRPSKGSAETIETLSRDSLLALHAAHFAPQSLIVSVVGALTPALASDVANEVFGPWSKAETSAPALPRVTQAVARRQLVLPMMNKSQADIAYGFTTITRNDPDYYAFWLLNVVLGNYAMGGRLGENIRERQGMAYYASSTFDPSILPGPLVVRAGVSAANVERTIRAIDEELVLLAKGGITAQELADCRQYMTGSMPRALETNEGIAQFLTTCEFFALGLDYDLRLFDLLGSVTADHVRDLARRYLDPGRAALVVAGPYEGR
ncbi:MAG: pitrilysin family protein [Vicinamibacterales bacterium]